MLPRSDLPAPFGGAAGGGAAGAGPALAYTRTHFIHN